MANKMNPDGSFGNRWGDTPTPHSTQEEHPFVWLERMLERRAYRMQDMDPDYLYIIMQTHQRDLLLAAIKAWREAGL